MPSIARRRLPALLALLRANGVTSYDDGAVKLTLALRPASELTEDARDTRTVRAGEPTPRKGAPRAAVDLAIGGIDYDPEAAEPRHDA